MSDPRVAIYDEDVQTAEEQLPPFIKKTANSELIYQNKNYEVRDIYLPDETNSIGFTITITKLHAGRQTRGHRHAESHEMYEFRKGRGLIMLNGYAYNIRAGLYVTVTKGVHHKVVNTSDTEDLTFLTYFPGLLPRPDANKQVIVG